MAIPVSHPALESAAELAACLESLADEAGAQDLQGLQDATWMLAEALHEAPEREPDPEALSLLRGWPELAAAYRRGMAAILPAMRQVLRHPALGLPLSEEEFDWLEARLAEGVPAVERAEEPAAHLDETPAFALDEAPAPSAEDLPSQASGLDVAPVPAQKALQGLPRQAQELIDLLLMQAGAVAAVLDNAESDPEAARDEFERFGNAARTVGLEGLAEAAAQVAANLHAGAGPELRALVAEWLAEAQVYLTAFTEPEAGAGLVARLADPRWPLVLAAEAAAAILARMRGPDTQWWQEAGPVRAATASAEEVSLALPADVNPKLLGILLRELPVHTRQLAAIAQRLQTGGSPEDIDTAQRIAHTLKGSANTVGVRGVAALTHQLEDILLACAKAGQVPGRALRELLLDAADCLEGMAEALLGQGPAPADALAVLQRILDFANRIDREGLPEPDAELDAVASALEAGAAPIAVPAAEPAPAVEESAAALVQIPVEQVEDLLRLSGESLIFNGQAQERLRRVKAQLQAMQAQFEQLRLLGQELEELVDLRDWSGRAYGRVRADFDALELDQYNELHTASRRMVEAAVDAREMGLDVVAELARMDEALDYQQRLVVDVQEAVMRARLVPVSTLLPRLRRGLRQTLRLTGKKAELDFEGGDLAIDGEVLGAIAEPLMHLLRNAVDHGLEAPEERARRGKPELGRIAVAFDREGNHALVRCRDDGRGLDYAAIRAAAEARGWLPPGQPASEQELARMILRPNFSTRAVSTHISGRGVGMDAVQAQVAALGGTLALRSVVGVGLTVELRVPLPLSRSHALLVRVGSQRVAVASRGLDQIFYSGVGQLHGPEDALEWRLDGVPYPAVRLGNLLRFPGSRPVPDPPGAILLVRTADSATAVLADAVFDSRELVVKDLGPYLPKLRGLMGATVLGDGTVTAVVDLPELLRAPGQPVAVAADWAEAAAIPEVPDVLVVDDSLSQRRALEQLLADAGFRVKSARDGMEAAEILAKEWPLLVLTDLEMPRMNGIELTAHIRAQPEGKSLPILMVTSRTTQRHRQLAEDAGVDAYFTKPVRDDDLLDKLHGVLAGAIAGPVRRGAG